MTKQEISQRAADNIRILSAAMVEKANSGHPGGAMGGADYIHVLFSEFLQYDPDDAAYPFRDRFFMDPGHMSPMLYSQLTLLGNYKLDELKHFRQWGSPTPGHPELDITRGVENTSGPLGLGHSFAIGNAIAERFLVARFGEQIAHRTYIYISDGGIQEEISQGVGRTAGFLGLGNVIMFYDANEVQLSTMVDEVMREDTAKKYEAWGWQVLSIDGNDQDQIRQAIQTAQRETAKPTLIIGHTIMGKGALKADGSSYEGQVETHGQPLGKSDASYERTIENLGGDPTNAFVLFPEVAQYYEEIKETKRSEIAAKKDRINDWRSSHPQLAEKIDDFYSGTLPEVDWAAIEQKPDQATRNASSTVLSYLADHVENMIVASADLSNSDKTDGFLKKTTAFKHLDFSGAFLQAGVSELSMAAICTGITLHGGVYAACGTFFVFSDYMKPALRVAALMEQPVVFVWTHDAFRVGEDGPTHQPIEQEAQIRLLEKLQNHNGENSFLVLRPADVHETTVAWQMAMENRSTPTGLILSRQGIKNIPGASYETATQVTKGGYIAQDCDGTPDVVLIANGSEVSTLIGGADLLNERGVKCRVVSVPSEGLFRNQSAEYQRDVLLPAVPKFGLTAGLPVTLEGLVGLDGRVVGMTHFGFSAPYTVLDEKFGFTAEHVRDEVLSFLK